MSNTAKLNLPLISSSQSQKHVTHNQSLDNVDILVMPSIKDRNLTTPPGSPVEGDTYIPLATATGAWVGKENQLAAFQNGAWAFYPPNEGWIVWVDDEDVTIAYDGVSWIANPGVLQNLSLLGVNTTADTTNKLAVASSAILFTNVGNGVQVKVNKAAVGDTDSFLFQTAFSGRAEFGCIGNDDFTFKVSPDGSTFLQAFVIDKDTADVAIKKGIILSRTGTAVSANAETEIIIGVTDTTVPRTITIQTAAILNGRTFVIKDESGGAATNNIIIATQGAETIDAVATLTINANYGGVVLYSDGTNLFTVPGVNFNSTDNKPATASTLVFKSYTIAGLPIGTHHVAGVYLFPATDANLTQASPTQVLGTANSPYGMHASLVAAAAGVASGGTGAVEIEVSGTSITDAGIRTALDTEVIVADITTMTTNQYSETVKKWIGQITYTLQNALGSTQTIFNADFNYGGTKYEDFGNINFTVKDFEITGLAGANDAGFNVELLHHKSIGWTYAATGFVAGNGDIVNLATDYGVESDLVNGEHFSYKRTNLNTPISGAGAEGVIIRVTLGANNAIDFMNLHIGVTT